MIEMVFIAFCLLTIGCALGVILARNPIYSAFSLILCFFGLAGVYVLWGANFIAMIQVLIYTGAIVVLFVFVVMLLDLVRASPSPSAGWLTVAVSGVAVWLFSVLLLRGINRAPIFKGAPDTKLNELNSIATLLFSEYLWPFEVLSVFLLAMIIAVYVLTRPAREKTIKGEVDW